MRSRTLLSTRINLRPSTTVLAIPLVWIGVWTVMALDAPLAHFARESGISAFLDNYQHSVVGWYIGRVMRQPGEWWLTVVSAGLLTIFHKQTWRAGGMMLLAFAPGAINGVLKWVTGRNRPFTGREAWDWDLFHNGSAGLFHQTNLGFASGHTTLAFAWATAMTLGLPRLRWVFYAVASLCGLQRMLSADHYLTDVLVGAALGIVTVRLMFRILSQIVPPAREGSDDSTPTIMAIQSGTQTHDRPHLNPTHTDPR